ncbi:MAG TPA: GNAT family N-acetyltransferase [Kofleriaceae bacterium]|jgi:phosphinothricin acetyltransferase
MGADRVMMETEKSPALTHPVYRNDADVTLRRADYTDRERIYEYNFSPDVRAVSGSPTAVSFHDHAGWFSKRIQDPSSPFWIIEHAGQPVGTIRIDAKDGANARISIALSAAARGCGIGKRAIQLACTKWCGAVVAEIAESNARSLAAFTACGFARIGSRDAYAVYLWNP